MRGNQLQFSQFQKLRLQKALDQLESLSSASSVLWSVLTSKYVCVRSLLSRYKPKAGDIVIGRVIEVKFYSFNSDFKLVHFSNLMFVVLCRFVRIVGDWILIAVKTLI